MKVIVGLGNPGSKYAGTRHNVGFDVIDYLAGSPGVGPFRTRFEADIAEAREGGEQVLYVKPMTFMNLSGVAVRAVMDFYKVQPTDMLVICDDFNLPLGKLRVRLNGSHGGQNGLRNIQQQLGHEAYPRLRIGVGAPNFGDAVDHVLGKWRSTEKAAVEESIAKAAQAVLVFVSQGGDACMNRFNGGDEKPKKPKLRVIDGLGRPPEAKSKPPANAGDPPLPL
ncbi:MAG: aminoacyl-tRNA hydrolase [Gemmataceae bacterium]